MTAANIAPPSWWTVTRGDIDAIIAQVGFNLAQMMIPVFLLAPAGLSIEFSIRHLLPGYALGFLIGSLGLCVLAARLARRTGRHDITAHVYGNNVPAVIAYSLAIMLPIYLRTHNAEQTWSIGAAAVIWTGLIKLAAAPFAGLIRKHIPHSACMTVFGAAMYSYLAMVLLQRLFDQPVIGLIALAIVIAAVFSGIPVTRWRIPPFLIAWLIPLATGIAIGSIHPAWQGLHPTFPWVASLAPVRALPLAIPYLSVIAPMAIYHVLQDIASVAGASAAGDDYDARSVLAWDGLGTLLCGAAGSVIAPIIYALHPPYKHIGARIGFSFWTPVLFVFIVTAGLTPFIVQLFPWPILAAMIAWISIGVGMATLRGVEPKYWSAVLLGLMIPASAVVTADLNSALPALGLSVANPAVQDALNRAIHWSSVQGLSNGFLFLVLVVAAVLSQVIDRQFRRAAAWCAIGAIFSWFGLMHSSVMQWGAQPQFAIGWLGAGVVIYSTRWWRGDVGHAP